MKNGEIEQNEQNVEQPEQKKEISLNDLFGNAPIGRKGSSSNDDTLTIGKNSFTIQSKYVIVNGKMEYKSESGKVPIAVNLTDNRKGLKFHAGSANYAKKIKTDKGNEIWVNDSLKNAIQHYAAKLPDGK